MLYNTKNAEKLKKFLKENDPNQFTWMEISNLINIEESIIRNMFKSLNIKKNKKLSLYDKKLISIQDYISKGLDNSQIALKLGVTTQNITSFLKKRGLKSPNKGKFIKFSNNQFQVILGSLLGDGSLEKSKKSKSGSRLIIKHCIKQKEYTTYKNDLLDNLVSSLSISSRIDSRRKVPEYQEVTLRTKSVFNLFQMRANWYIPKKEIFENDFKNIEGLGLAIWFMDDGYRSGKTVSICTNNFSLESLLKIQNLFLNKFDIETTIQKSGVIRIRTKDYYKFKNLILEYMHNTMLYKLP